MKMDGGRWELLRRVTGGAVLLATAALAIAACGGSSSNSSTKSSASAGDSSKPFTLLFIGDLSGPTKLLGSEELGGLKAAADYINGHGGMSGHKVTIETSNDGGEPTAAVSGLIKYLTSNPAPDMVWAGSESGETSALLPVLAKRKILSESSTDGEQLLRAEASEKYPNQFDSSSSIAPLDAKAATWFKGLGVHKVGILEESLAYTQGETPFTKKALEEAGIQFTVASFPATATSVTAELAKLRGEGAEAVYAEALGPAAGYTLKGRAQIGWKAPLLGDLAFAAEDLTTLVPAADLAGVSLVVAHDQPSTASSPGIAAFKQYDAPYGDLTAGINTASEAWDGLIVVNAAAKQAHSIELDPLTSALENLTPSSGAEAPLFATYPRIGYTAEDHENVQAEPADFPVIKPGPVKGGQVVSP